VAVEKISMAKIHILKRKGDEIIHEVKEDAITCWMVLVGLKLPEVDDNKFDENFISSGRHTPIQDWGVFNTVEDKLLIINKRYIAFIEED
jgi:hypothetical protein